MNPIRILHLTPPGFGGIDSYIFGHYRHMDQQRFRFDFMTQNLELENAEQYQDFSYRVWTLPVTAAQDRSGFIKRVRKILQEGYDVLHLHTSYWTGFLLEELAKEAGIPKVILHAHSTAVDENDPEKRLALSRRHEEIKRAFSPDLATDYWACSWKAAGWLFGEQIPGEKIRIMKNAIEVERFRFSQQKRKKLRQEFGIEEDTLVLGTAGRLSYQKNQAFLIDVFSDFHRRHPNSKLLLVGDGELRGTLKLQIAEKGLEKDVLMLGWRTNVEDYLQAMDVFLLPSRFEGLGIAAVEAAASGLPCLVSDQVPREVAFAENIRHIPLDISAWTAALEETARLHMNRQDGAKAVRAAGYDIKRQAKVLEALYEQ